MVTHTQAQSNTKATKAQFVAAYRAAEKRAITSAGGLAFLAEDRLTLNAMRVALGYDFQQAAEAVSLNPADYARHWQRMQHWAKQISKGEIRVAPEAAEFADRTHKKPTRKGNGKKSQNRNQSAQTKSEPKQIKDIVLPTHQLGMVFSDRAAAEAHLQEVMYGLARLGMDDMDALVPAIQSQLIKARQELEMEAKAQAVVTVLEGAGIIGSDAARILEIAKTLMPSV